MRNIVSYGAALVVFLGLDFTWIGFLSQPIYHAQIGPLLLATFKPVPAVLFYLLYMAGLVLFVIGPALNQRKWQAAALLGAAFGLVAYATYDLTNLATLRGFTTTITLVDMAWGAFATAAASTAGYAAARRFD